MTEERIRLIYHEMREMKCLVKLAPELGPIYFGDLLTKLGAWREQIGLWRTEAQEDVYSLRLALRSAQSIEKRVGALEERAITGEIPQLKQGLEDHQLMLVALDTTYRRLTDRVQEVRRALDGVPTHLKEGAAVPNFMDQRSHTKDPSKDATLIEADEFLQTPERTGPRT